MQLNAKTGRRIAKNVTKYNKLNKLFTTFFFKKNCDVIDIKLMPSKFTVYNANIFSTGKSLGDHAKSL